MSRPLPSLTHRGLIASSIGLAILAAIAWYFEAGNDAGAYIEAHRTKKDTAAGETMYFLTAIFHGAALAWLCLAYYAAGGSGRRTARAILALTLAGIAGAVMKECVVRLRPNASDLNSFPSGHVAGAVAVAATLSLGRRRVLVIAILFSVHAYPHRLFSTMSNRIRGEAP